MRNRQEIYTLTDAEKRDPIELIQQDKRAVELMWNGRTREVYNALPPFQSLERVDEPRRGLEVGGGRCQGRGR